MYGWLEHLLNYSGRRDAIHRALVAHAKFSIYHWFGFRLSVYVDNLDIRISRDGMLLRTVSTPLAEGQTEEGLIVP